LNLFNLLFLANDYHENEFSNQLMPINYQNQSQLSVGNQSFNQLTTDMSQNISYNYDNYQEVYDADGYCTGLPPSVAATAFPPTYHNYQNQTFEDDNSHQMAFDPQSYQQQYPSNYSTQELLPTPSNQPQNQWKRNPLVGAPTVVRYSPDEGYAEESQPFHLEGTEV
jgi:hypothetical protein